MSETLSLSTLLFEPARPLADLTDLGVVIAVSPDRSGAGTETMTQQDLNRQDERIENTVREERNRLFNFIRKRVDDETDAEDILQDVFYEFVEAYRLMKPIEQAGAWLFRVARNRIIDRFRKKKPVAISALPARGEEEDAPTLADLLPTGDPDADPDAAYARKVILEELSDALEELPEEQREAFVSHELEGESFKTMSERSGVPVNTLISRKRYAVLFLRERLRELYHEFITD